MSDSPHHADSKRKKADELAKPKREDSKRKDQPRKSDPKKDESKLKKEDSKRIRHPADDKTHHHHEHSRHHSKKPSSSAVAAAAAAAAEDETKKKKKKGEDSESESESERDDVSSDEESKQKINEDDFVKEEFLPLEVIPNDPFLQTTEETPLSKLVMDGTPEELEKALAGTTEEVLNEALGESAVSLLHLAAARGNPDIIKALLKKKASCNVRDKFDNSPLHYAAYFNHQHILTLLLDYLAENSSHEAKPQRGKSPRMKAAAAADPNEKPINPEVSRALNKHNEHGITPLYFAAANGNAEMCEEMLKRGANPNKTGPMNRTPLHEAVLSRNPACVTVLMKAGSDLSLRDIDQRTAIHYSVLLPVECRQIVMILTTPKKHFDDMDRFDKSALHYAVLQNFDDSIGLFTLVSEGSNVCIVYDLRMLMEQNVEKDAEKKKALEIESFPVPIKMPRHQKRAIRREDSGKLLTGTATKLYTPAPIPKKVKPTGKIVFKSESGDNQQRQAPNRFGFEVINNMTNVSELTPKEMEREMELSKKWAEYTKPEVWPKFSKNVKQVKALCAQGLPEAVRGKVWALLGGVPDLIKKQPNTYSILTSTIAKRDVAHQLDLDVKRSHLEHERFAHPYMDGQLSLFNVMRAYSLHDKKVEYTQGMSDVGGLLLIYLTEEETFWLFSQLMFDERWQLRDVFAAGFPLLQQHCFVQAQLLAKYHPSILKHMKKVDFDPLMLQPHAMEWFMTLYIRVLPYAFTVRIFDVLLSRGYYIVFRVAMALFELMKKDILSMKEMPDLMQLLKNPTESCPYIVKMTPDDFMKVVMKYKITQKMVDKYVAQYKKSQQKKK